MDYTSASYRKRNFSPFNVLLNYLDGKFIGFFGNVTEKWKFDSLEILRKQQESNIIKIKITKPAENYRC